MFNNLDWTEFEHGLELDLEEGEGFTGQIEDAVLTEEELLGPITVVPEILSLSELILPVGLFAGAVGLELWLSKEVKQVLGKPEPQDKLLPPSQSRREMQTMLGALQLEGSVPFRQVRALRIRRHRRR